MLCHDLIHLEDGMYPIQWDAPDGRLVGASVGLAMILIIFIIVRVDKSEAGSFDGFTLDLVWYSALG